MELIGTQVVARSFEKGCEPWSTAMWYADGWNYSNE